MRLICNKQIKGIFHSRKEVYRMERGDNYLITYHNMNNKKILAMFLEEYNGMYLFKNIHGEFGVTKKKIDDHEITLELIED